MKLTAESTVFNDEKVQNKFSELVVDADGIRTEVSKKVGNEEVISRINQSAESVKIQAKKVSWDEREYAIDIDIPSMSTTIYQLTPCEETVEKTAAKRSTSRTTVKKTVGKAAAAKKNEDKTKVESKVSARKPEAPKAPKKASGASRRRKG